MPISIFPIIVSTQLVVAVADRVPAFDIARSCKLDVAATTGLSVDQSLKSCVNDENKARQQLASQWSKFSASSKAQCIPQESVGGTRMLRCRRPSVGRCSQQVKQRVLAQGLLSGC